MALNTGVWHRLFLAALAIHLLATLPILNHVVTGCDPGWWSYLSFDLLHGRPLLSNQRADQLIDVQDSATYVFFAYDLRCNLFWDCLIAGVMFVFGEGYWAPHVFALVVSLAFVWTTYAIVVELCGDRVLAAQVGLLLVIDYQVFWTGTMTRPGIAAATFAFVGIYLLLRWLRSGHLGWMASAALAWAAAFTTHPLTFVVFASALFVAAGALLARHRGDWRTLVARGWPIVVVGVSLIVFMYAWSKAFGLVDLTEKRAQTFDLWNAMSAEFRSKFWNLYTRRFALPVLLITGAFAALAAWRCWRFRDRLLVATFAMLGSVFLLSAVFDSTNFDERLLYYSPLLAVLVGFGLRIALQRIERPLVRVAIVLGIVALMMVPRAGKYYQILTNWRHTDYAQYVEFVKTHVPAGSVIVSDVRLVWGLQGHGLKVLQFEEFKDSPKRAFGRKVIDKVQFVVLNDVASEYPSWLTREKFFATLGASQTRKIASFRGNSAWGYNTDVIAVEFAKR